MDRKDPHVTRSPVSPQLVLGLLVLTLGVLFLLDNLRIVDAEDFLRFWPVALIAVGVIKLLQRCLLPGLIWASIGMALLVDELDIFYIDFWDFWPLALVLFGIHLILRSIGTRRWEPTADSSATINAVAVMGGVVRRSSSKEFRGGDLTAVMGGCEMDLRHATLAGNEAVIDTFALWGGIEIFVPEGWAVVGKVFPLMGGFEDKTRPPADEQAPRLVVRGFAIMGGVEVKN